MGQIIKVNTVFSNPIENMYVGDEPSIRALNKVIITTNGDLMNFNGYVVMNNMKVANFESKAPFYVHGYAIYNGDLTETPRGAIFDSYVYLDGSATPNHQNRVINVVAEAGKFIVPLIVHNPEEQISGDTTIEDIVMYVD